MSRRPPKSLPSVAIGYFKAAKNKTPLDTEDEMDICGKIVVITGANSGIGAEVALQLAKRGARVLMACRDMDKAQTVLQDIQSKVNGAELSLFQLDLGDLASVRACAGAIKASVNRIDILINNAGVILPKRQLLRTKDEFEVHMGINYLGPFLFTNLLQNLVTRAPGPGRILFTSSMAFKMAELDLNDLMGDKSGTFGPFRVGLYCNSKLAILYNAYSLGKRLQGTGVHTYALCPGVCLRTAIFRNSRITQQQIYGWIYRGAERVSSLVLQTMKEGASTTLFCALSNKCAHESGLMYRCNGLWVGAMEDAVDQQAADRLWELSERLVAGNY